MLQYFLERLVRQNEDKDLLAANAYPKENAIFALAQAIAAHAIAVDHLATALENENEKDNSRM